jgi:hypothetical protein
MAKKKTVIIGSIVKNKDKTKPDYIKIMNDVSLKAGQFLNLESKAERQKRLDESVENGKLSGKLVEDIQASIDKTPDFERFRIVSLVDTE